jgi:hypothetical protein
LVDVSAKKLHENFIKLRRYGGDRETQASAIALGWGQTLVQCEKMTFSPDFCGDRLNKLEDKLNYGN